MKSHKGKRLEGAINYILQEYGTNKRAIADRIGISADMIYKYFKMPEFSSKVLFRLNALEDHYGINAKYFSDEDAEMLLQKTEIDTDLKSALKNAENTISLQQQLIEQLHRQTEILKENALLAAEVERLKGQKK